MAYGTIKVDTITFTDGGIDKSVAISGLVQNPTFTGNVTATGTISGDIVRGQTISGVTVTGTTANFTSGNFINISGGTHTITSGVFALGTAANPSISFVSDPNSGLYSPGADQVAISTNGTGRLFVDASGNVGVGAASPASRLEVGGGSGYTVGLRLRANPADPNYYSDLTHTATDGLDLSVEDFGYTDTRMRLRRGFVGINTETPAAGLDVVGITGIGDPFRVSNSTTELCRITSAGRLGLGTSSPSSQLHCTGDIKFGDAITFSRSISTGLVTITDATAEPFTQGFAFRTNETDEAYRFQNGDGTSTYLTIRGSGAVGIGTTSPAVAFQVGATGSGGAAIDTTNSALHGTFGTGGGLSLRAQISSSSGGGDVFLGGSSRGDANVNSIVFSTANTIRAKIDANGYFTVSSNRFNGFEFIDSGATIYHSFGSGGNLTLRAQTTATAGGGEIFLGGSTRGDSNVNAIVFSGANSERARIDSSGRLLVGTSSTSSTAGLIVQGAGGAAPGIIRACYTTATPADGDTFGYLVFGDSAHADAAWVAAARDGGTWSGASKPTRLVFSTCPDGASSPTERMRIDSLGRVSLNLLGTTNQPNLSLNIGGIGDPGDGSWVTPRIDFTGSSLASAGTTFIGATGGFGARALVFATGSDAAGTERMRLDSSGRLLIGTNTSEASNTKLQVVSSQAEDGLLLRYANTPTGSDGPSIKFANNNNNGVGIVTSSIHGILTTGGVGGESGRLSFRTMSSGSGTLTERMTITNGGQVFIGTTSGNSSYQVIVGGDAPGGGAGGIYVTCDGVGDANYLSASDNIGFHFYSAGASSKFFYVENDGDVRNTNNSYGAISDLKLKQDIEDAGSQWNDLKAVQVRKFRFKSNPDDALHIGVIAQELELVSPGLIDETIDRDQEGNDLGTVTKSVKYSVLYMKAVKALQEAMERIETLEAKVAALEAQ
jgi:hypothetical protein